MPEISWEDGNGHFIPETWDGRRLADEIDEIFSSENPEEFIRNIYGNPKIEAEIHSSRRDSIITNLCLGALSIGALIGEYSFISQLYDSLKSIH